MQRKPSIYELAKATGFSVSTVSKALNHTGRISEATRQKILDKASELNYVASYHAKALSLKKSWIIGVIFSDNLGMGFSHPHFAAILDSFKQTVEQAGYEITFINRNMGNVPMTYLEFCRYRKVEGVFIVNYYSLSKQVPELIASGIPLVSADAGYDDVTTITADDIAGGRLAANYLIDLGHNQRVYHIAGPLYTVSAQRRRKGFVDVMTARNIPHYDIFEADNFGFEDGYRQALRILNSGPLPTAIFAAGDWLALGAIKAFQEHGIRIPEDLSIIGFDNLDFLSFNQPGLTTIAQNKHDIGRTAASALLDQIDGKTTESKHIDVSIVERDTCRSIR